MIGQNSMIERIEYRGWHNAYKISNGRIHLIVLADVGPRIIWYGFCGGENQLHEVDADAGVSGGTSFRLYGGHRLWVSPEVESTYFPDNVPVSVSQHGREVCFTAPPEMNRPGTGLQKEMRIRLEDSGSHLTITHRITNHAATSARLAPWTPTMMRPGGRGILPLPPRAAMDNDHLQPVGILGLWSYTDFSDPRWTLGSDFIQLRQDSNPTGRFQEQMIGIYNPAGWVAYFRDGTLFVKQARVVENAQYPDFGCNLELFTNPDFLEVETLGPLCDLQPGQSVSHIEQWWLLNPVPAGDGEAWIRTVICPLVEKQVLSSPGC